MATPRIASVAWESRVSVGGRVLVFALGFAFWPWALALAANDTIRIMPLGNSITESIDPHVSYRCYLWKKLVDDGLAVDFVGNRTGVFKAMPDLAVPSPCPFAGFDANHEGHCSWRVDELLYGARVDNTYGYPGNVRAWARFWKPDMVLLHAGTVDVLLGDDATSTTLELGYLIDTLQAINPRVVIFIAQLVGLVNQQNDAKIRQINAGIPGIASHKSTASSPVIVVDQYTGFTPSSDTWDNIHPNDSGVRKMADKWYAAITEYLQTRARAEALKRRRVRDGAGLISLAGRRAQGSGSPRFRVMGDGSLQLLPPAQLPLAGSPK